MKDRTLITLLYLMIFGFLVAGIFLCGMNHVSQGFICYAISLSNWISGKIVYVLMKRK